MKIKFKILTSHWFLIGLTVLLLNDFIFKELYGNWLTGKLSDFAGLFIFPLFWTALFPKHKNKIFVFTALFFIFWKSPFSQGFIDTWNNFIFFKIARVVDFSDLIALLTLPLAYIYDRNKELIKVVQLHPSISFFVALFSFMATSLPLETIEFEKEYSFDFPKDTLESRLYFLPNIVNPIEDYYALDSSGLFMVNKFSMDTVNSENDLIHLFTTGVITLDIKEDFCYSGYLANVALSGDSVASALKLLGFQYSCKKNKMKDSSLPGKDVQEKLIGSFENKIIQTLKNE